MLDLVKVKVRLDKHKIPITLLVHDSAAMGYFNSLGLFEVAQKLESKGFHLADHNITSDALTGIEILIGVDHSTRLIARQKRSHGTSLFVTRGGGMIPFGPLPRWAVTSSQQSISQIRCARIICENKPELEVTQLWDLERIGILSEPFSPNERETISLVRSNMQQTESGYIVRLPFKDETHPSVNYRTARAQLNQLVQRVESDEQFGQQYNKVVESYVEKEFIEQIPNQPVEGHYMPHRAVFKKSATTPLRIVFNASSRPNEGSSLNDCLMTAPSLAPKLHEILVQFRQGKYAVTADISKTFHRIIVDEEDRKFLKFLWINLNSQELLTFQFKVVLFGATCSPYLLQETLYTHLSQNVEGNSFLDKFYVDNYMNTYDSQAELVSDKIRLDNVMNRASMPLQEWVSNNEYLNFLYQLAVPVTQNVLGISWNPYTDNMNIVVGEKLIHEDSWRYTKRKTLSLVSSVYDPLGWVSLLTVRGKIFLQTLWKEKMGWDQTLNTEQVKVIRDILIDLQRVGEFSFPRHILHEHSELHVFTDTSSRAYGAAVYTVNETCQCSNLLISKARVAPCQEGRLTIPKLELTASKGMPSLLLSDNHKTFIAGETFLLEMQQDPAVHDYLSATNIRWKHQTPRSSWMVGHFERLVQTIKASLATAISRKLLTLEEFTTIVKGAENIVNSRPLTYQSDNSRDIPLTPSQLAWGRDLTLMPPLLQPGDPLDEDYDAKATRAQYVVLSNALERFRKCWHNEYLLSLREKHYNLCAENSSHHLRVGQLVMVKHDNIHRIEWPLGVITTVYADERGVIRTVEVEECGRRHNVQLRF